VNAADTRLIVNADDFGLSQAINREDRNWLLYYLRSKIEHEAGDSASARADLRRAQQLNPLESCLREGWDGCG